MLLNSFLSANESNDSLLALSWEELNQVKVIIATGTEQAISKAPATVTVITSDDIKKTGAINLTEILETVPGIHINTNHFGNRPLVHMRGTGSLQTLLMVNGNDTSDLVWSFGIFWKGMPVSAIERIEVIRGPGSALYGADASAGVINVITKTAGKIEETEVGMRAGSFDTKAAFIQTGGEFYEYDLALTAEFSTTDGPDPYINSDRNNEAGKADYGWDNQDIRFSVTNGNFQFLANYVKHDNLETGMTGAGYFDPVTEADDKRLDLDLNYNNKHFSRDWGLMAKLHYQDLEYTSNDGFQESPPDVDYPNGKINHMSSEERQISFDLSGLYSGIEKHSIRMGAGYDWQDLYSVKQQVNFGTGADGNPIMPGEPIEDISDTDYAFAPEKTRKIYHFFLQDTWAFANDWELTTGVRYDHYSDFGETVNPRIALTWQNTKNLTTKLMYGQGFRAPSYQELYAITSRSIPNANLEPEESETIELAFAYAATKNVRLGMNLFNFETKDVIARDVNRQYQNSGTHKIQGIELEAKWQVTKEVLLSGNYTHRNPDDNDYRQITEADQEAYFRSDWHFHPDWNWNVQASWIADRERADSDMRSDINDYIITDTTLRYTGLEQWEFTASIRNLFDEDAREHTGASVEDDLPLAERNFYAEVRYKF
ncbi:MAG: TonB-dependent receptor [Gammaproteobacteria bacterium]|nr:TonB-dependent receptor [Gammaproteobacteria bacterium]